MQQLRQLLKLGLITASVNIKHILIFTNSSSVALEDRERDKVIIYFHPSISVAKVTVPLRPQVTCDVLAVKNKSSSHCWVLVYCPPDVNAVDTRELYD